MRMMMVRVMAMVGFGCAIDVAGAALSHRRPSSGTGAAVSPATGARQTPGDDVALEHLVFVSGFAHSGTTLVADKVRNKNDGGQKCWIGSNIYVEAQWRQTAYPAWLPMSDQNEGVCANHTAWAKAMTLGDKKRQISDLLPTSAAAREALADTVLGEWRANVRGGGHCRTWVGKDPRFDTLKFLPELFAAYKVTSVATLRHPFAQVYLSDHSMTGIPRGFDNILDQWVSVWNFVFTELKDLARYLVVRMEDLISDEAIVVGTFRRVFAEPEPGHRRLKLHGRTVEARFAFERKEFGIYANVTRARLGEAAVASLDAFVREHFGYDLLEPTTVHQRPSTTGTGALYSKGIEAVDRLVDPVAAVFPTWPSPKRFNPREWSTGRINDNSFERNCFACSKPFCAAAKEARAAGHAAY